MIEEFVERWIALVGTMHALPQVQRQRMIPLMFEPFCELVREFTKAQKDRRKRSFETYKERLTGKPSSWLHIAGAEDPAVAFFIQEGLQPDWTPDFEGWLNYLTTRSAPLKRMLSDPAKWRPAVFPEAGRREHTLIVAATGSGKSELMKVLLHHYVQHSDAGVLLLDPGDNLAREVAHWPILHERDRLIYVQPGLRPDRTVGFNLFGGGQHLSRSQKSHRAEEIALIIGEMTADLTMNMRTLVAACTRVLLDFPDPTLADLNRMLVRPDDQKSSSFAFDRRADHRRDRLMKAAWHHPDQKVRNFFQAKFDTVPYHQSRGYLMTRIDAIESMADICDALYGPGTIDLEKELNACKIVVVHLKHYGNNEQAATMGRMLVAMVAAMGLKRGRQPDDTQHRPVHLFIDEVSVMVSQQMVVILNQLRQSGVHATLAQQVGGQGFTADQKAALLINTRTHIVHMDTPQEGLAMLDWHGDASELPPVGKGEFWVKWANAPGVQTVKVRSDLWLPRDANNQPIPVPELWVDPKTWQRFIDRMDGPGGYYRDARMGEPDLLDPQNLSFNADEPLPDAQELPLRRKAGRQPKGPKLTLSKSKNTPERRPKSIDNAAQYSPLIGGDDAEPG